MLKLTKKEKLIWDLCSKIEHKKAPSKQDVWMRLEQQIEISAQPQKIKTYKIPIFKRTLLPRLITAFFITILISIPTIKMLNTINIYSSYGHKTKTVSLNDGTKVHLNAGTTLSYSKNFNSTSREVTLSGEAYFEVEKGSSPFIISTDLAKVTVLGTKFNVRSREDGFEIGVNEGKVKIENKTKSIDLKKGEQVDISIDQPKIISVSKVSNFYPGWKNNKLICDNSSLEKICKELERRYDIKIQFQDNLQKNTTISGIIDLSPNNLDSVLSSISLLSKRKFKLQGDSYILL